MVTELVPSDRIPFETPLEPWHKGDHSSQQLVHCLRELRSPCMLQCPPVERSASELALKMMVASPAALSNK